jgi:hypothetical protein
MIWYQATSDQKVVMKIPAVAQLLNKLRALHESSVDIARKPSITSSGNTTMSMTFVMAISLMPPISAICSAFLLLSIAALFRKRKAE